MAWTTVAAALAFQGLLAGSNASVEIYDNGDLDSVGYRAFTSFPDASAKSAYLCKSANIKKLFGAALKKTEAEWSKTHKGKFGIPTYQLTPTEAESFAKHECDLKVGSELTAHGEGWVKRATIKGFAGSVSGYGLAKGGVYLQLSAAVDGVSDAPFFFATAKLAAATNAYERAEVLAIEEATLPPAVHKRLAEWLPGKGLKFRVDARKLYKLREKVPRYLAKVEVSGPALFSDDAPSRWTDYVVASEQGLSTIVWGEGDPGLGLGSLSFRGVLDVDGDGKDELLLEADYMFVVFRERAGTWERFMIGKRPSTSK